MDALLYAGVISGTIGGVGFALANCLKLFGISTGITTNWHSLLEQSYGLINGIGIAVVMLRLRGLPTLGPSLAPERLAAVFVLAGTTYLNLWKNVPRWVNGGAVGSELYGFSTSAWFNLAYIAIGVLMAFLATTRQPAGLWNGPPLLRVQALYLVLLWWMVIGNFTRALVGFTAQRLVTEGVIYLNALVCTALVLYGMLPREVRSIDKAPYSRLLASKAIVTFISVTLLCWGLIRLTQGDKQIGHASRHIRFGPDATATSAKPSADKPHP
jgi:hypothetical protein